MPVSIAVAAVLAVHARRSAFGESVRAALGLLLVSMVRAQSQPLELG
jgi:hypothetical protein